MREITEEQFTKVAWLNRAFYAEKKVYALKALRDKDERRAQSLSPDYSGNDKGKSDGRKNAVEELLLTFALSDEKYENALREYNRLRQEVQHAIESMHDDELEALFTYRYLEYRTIEEIAELMHYDMRTIQRKHKSGLMNISIE